MEEERAGRLVLPSELRRRILARAAEAVPREACGILVGALDERGVVVERLEAARNLETERARDRYRLAPDDFLAAECRARDDRLEVVGFWHSHPAAAATPSATDRETAWEGYSYLIVAPDGPPPRLRSWRRRGDRLIEEALVDRMEG